MTTHAATVDARSAPLSVLRAMSTTTKRVIDIVVAALLLALTLPLLLLAAALIRLELGSPIVFAQERTGRAMRRFRLYKLRTMGPERDPDGRWRTDSERCGRIGRLLRRYSIDELPQLINIIRGDLSLVGPRPLLPRYDPWYSEREQLRFTVRPGITGLSQVNGRNRVPWNERLELDAHYVEQWSLLLDLKILIRTAIMIPRASGVVIDPSTAMLDLDEERGLICMR